MTPKRGPRARAIMDCGFIFTAAPRDSGLRPAARARERLHSLACLPRAWRRSSVSLSLSAGTPEIFPTAGRREEDDRAARGKRRGSAASVARAPSTLRDPLLNCSAILQRLSSRCDV